MSYLFCNDMQNYFYDIVRDYCKDFDIFESFPAALLEVQITHITNSSLLIHEHPVEIVLACFPPPPPTDHNAILSKVGLKQSKMRNTEPIHNEKDQLDYGISSVKTIHNKPIFSTYLSFNCILRPDRLICTYNQCVINTTAKLIKH